MLKMSKSGHMVDTIVKSKRVQVSFTTTQWKILTNLKGMMGDSDADVVRNIVLAWLSEKSFVSNIIKNKALGDN